ncbi:MAG: DUF2264 domain-containing protein, partial [Proteobacteria bacterium]|nr:DUF2264 domain-containing protein [Pseudomonadota bacterium]
MKRRHFLQLGTTVMAGLPFAGLLKASARRSLAAVFAEPVGRGDWVALWAELVQGYDKVLSPGKAWGSILDVPDRRRWKELPKAKAKTLPGDPELTGRMLWAIAGWFTRPGRPTALQARDGVVDLKPLLIDTVANATNPKHPEYWDLRYAGGKLNGNQFSVEAPPTGIAALVARERFRKELPADFASNVAEWLRLPATGHRDSNWNLFHALAAVTRAKLGGSIDTAMLKRNLTSCMDMYLGQGVFTDGTGRHFDDYTFWVFATHFGLWWEMDRQRHPELARRIPDMLRQVTRWQPYTFGADGSHPEYGRSITYKFTRLASLVQAHRLGFCDVPPGLIRRIIRLHVLYYMRNGALDLRRQRLLQTLSADGSPHMRDFYNYAGSTYWAMQTFSELWRLRDNDPLWTAAEQPLPVEQDDFVYKMPVQGWKFVGTRNPGSIVQINHGADGPVQYLPKYQKQAYHSQLGYVAAHRGYAPCDHMATLRIRGRNHVPTLVDWDKELPEIGRKVEIYEAAPGLEVTHLLLPLGETLLRFTRIEVPDKLPARSQLHLGGYALGFSRRERPKLTRSTKLLAAAT